MKFRVRFKNGKVTQDSNFSLLPSGQVVGEEFFGNCDIDGAKIELIDLEDMLYACFKIGAEDICRLFNFAWMECGFTSRL